LRLFHGSLRCQRFLPFFCKKNMIKKYMQVNKNASVNLIILHAFFSGLSEGKLLILQRPNASKVKILSLK